MKFVLIFLGSVLVVSSHQYLNDQRREMPWVSPYPPQALIDKYQPFLIYFSKPKPPTIYPSRNEGSPAEYIASDGGKQHSHTDGIYVYPDTQLRFKGFNRNSLSYSNEQLDARFLFANHGVYSNPFLKTVTFTHRTLLSITSYVTCVPSNQVLFGANATPCRRKRSANQNVAADEIAEGNQWTISPSETQKLTTTTTPSPSQNFNQLSSSKDDDTTPEELSALNLSNVRQQRLLFANRNQFIISSTVTSFTFSNATVTVTKNLFNALQAVQCVALAAANMPQCIACLPPGFVVCNLAG